MSPPRVLVALVALALPGCSSGSSGASSGDASTRAGLGSPCATDDDCAEPYLCSYPVDGGCGAKGTCTSEDLGPCADAGPPLCACDGVTPVDQGCTFGRGRVPVRVQSATAACMVDASEGEDSGADSSPDSGADSAPDGGAESGADASADTGGRG